jgi:hypothetical protein
MMKLKTKISIKKKKLESIVLTSQTYINIISFSEQVYKIKYHDNTGILTK